jgi:hypothetical protein
VTTCEDVNNALGGNEVAVIDPYTLQIDIDDDAVSGLLRAFGNITELNCIGCSPT